MITGARGWEHEQWQGTYYPPQIAQDWHLKFYAKDFQTTLAPVSFWSNCSIEEIEEFCSDVGKDYPLVFEQNENETDKNILTLQQTINELTPINWIMFKKDGWQKSEDKYQIKQAEIIHNNNFEENALVFCVHADKQLRDTTLREIMKFLKTEFKQFNVIYCYFDGELVAIDMLNTVQTLRRMLNLNY